MPQAARSRSYENISILCVPLGRLTRRSLLSNPEDNRQAKVLSVRGLIPHLKLLTMTVPKRCRPAPSRNKLAGRSCIQFFRTLARFCSSKRHSAETMCRKHNLLSVSLADPDSCSTLSGHRQHCIACETHTAALIDCQQRVPSLRWRTAGPHLGLGDGRRE